MRIRGWGWGGVGQFLFSSYPISVRDEKNSGNGSGENCLTRAGIVQLIRCLLFATHRDLSPAPQMVPQYHQRVKP